MGTPAKQPRRQFSLRAKFILVTALLLVGYGVITTAVTIRTQQGIDQQRLRETATAVTALLAAALPDHVQHLDIEAIRLLARDALRQEGVQYAYVFDTQGRILADGTKENSRRDQVLDDPLSQQAIRTRQTLVQEAGANLDVTVPITLGDQHLGGVRLGFSQKMVRAESVAIRNRQLALGAGILLAALVLVVLLARSITQPLARVIAGAEAFARGEWDQPLAVHTRDELETLATSFNRMVATLQRTTVSRDYVERIIQTMNDSLVVVGRDGRLQTVNEATCALLGYDARELENLPVTELFGGSLPLTSATVRTLVRTGVVHSVEAMIRTKDKQRIPVLLSAAVMRDSAGRIEAVVGVGRDITERHRAAAELRQARDAAEQAREAAEQAREAAEQANQAKSAFLSRMSHELRTPLTAILGFAQLLVEDPEQPLTAEQQDSAQHIRRAGDHLKHLIEEILDLARIEAGRLPLDLEPVLLGPELDEVVALVRPLAVPRRIELVEQTEAIREQSVRADPHRLRQVLLNLLTNAIKYSEPGGSVTLTGSVTGESRVCLRVEDTGQGIPEGQQNYIFEPFQRLGAELTEVEGLGIGLAITKRLLDLMDGSITVESVVGQGSCFTITLPLDVPDALSAAAPAPVADPAVASGPATQTVLYVEDHPATLTLVERILRQRPQIKLVTSPQARMGLELAQVHRPDLVILDINLPGMDGFEALEQLRQQPTTRDTPVLALSASAMPRDIQRGLTAGFDAYLTKPIEVPEFLAAVDAALSARHAANHPQRDVQVGADGKPPPDRKEVPA